MFKLAECIGIPKTCLVDNTIFKKLFYENANLNQADKKLFINHIDKIKWNYCLKNETINIKPFKDEIREYNEVEFFTVLVKSLVKTNRLAEIIMRTIPYPIVLTFQHHNEIQIYTAHQRINQADSSKNTLDEIIHTELIHLDHLDELDKTFFNSLKIKNLRFTNFYTLYQDIVDSIIKYNGSKLIGENLSSDTDEIKSIYDEIGLLNNKIQYLRNSIKKETQFNKTLEINMQIKKLEQKKKDLINDLN